MLKIQMKHSGNKSKHKFFGLGRITSTLVVFVLVALACANMMSGTACAKEGNFRRAKLAAMIADFQAFEDRFEEIADEIEASASEGITALKNAVIANTDAAETAILDNTDAAEASINQFIRDTHLVDPFDVAVNICAEIVGGAAIEGTAGFGVPVTQEGSLGIDFFGNGAKIKIARTGEIGVEIGLNAGVGMSVTACINGVFTRQNQDSEEEAAVIASVPPIEQDFVTALFALGNNYRQRVKDTAEATNLVVVGVDRLNSSLDAFAGVTALNAQRLGQFIVSNFDGTDDSSPLGALVGDLSASGNGMDIVLSDLAGVVDLSSSDFSHINTAIFSSIQAIGLDGGGLASSLEDLSGFATAVTSFKDMEVVIDGIVTTINNILP